MSESIIKRRAFEDDMLLYKTEGLSQDYLDKIRAGYKEEKWTADSVSLQIYLEKHVPGLKEKVRALYQEGLETLAASVTTPPV